MSSNRAIPGQVDLITRTRYTVLALRDKHYGKMWASGKRRMPQAPLAVMAFMPKTCKAVQALGYFT